MRTRIPCRTVFVELSVKKKVDAWAANVEKLASIAKTHPHAAYAAYCHGLRHRWKLIMRTTPIDGVMFTPLEAAIRNHLLPSISGKWDISDSMRKILAMPTRCGGLNSEETIQLRRMATWEKAPTTEPRTRDLRPNAEFQPREPRSRSRSFVPHRHLCASPMWRTWLSQSSGRRHS